MNEEVEWVISDLLPSIMPTVKAQIDAKNRVSKHFKLTNAEADLMTCSVVANYHNKGISIEKIEESEIIESLTTSFKIMLDWGIDLKTLGK